MLGWLFSKTDLATVWETFKQIPFSLWAGASLAFCCVCTLAATRWFLLAKTLSLPGKWFRYLFIYFTGQFFSQFLPTSVGGDVFRVIYIAKGKAASILNASCSVLADRVIGVLTMLLSGATAVLLYPQEMSHEKSSWLLYGTGIVLGGVVLFAPLLLNLLRKFRSDLATSLATLLGIWKRPGLLLQIALLSFCINVIFVLLVIGLGTAIGISIHPAYYFAIFPLTTLITVLPISFNGIGLRESAFVYLLSLQNVAFERAFALSLGVFIIHCIIGVVGGIVYAMGLHVEKPES